MVSIKWIWFCVIIIAALGALVLGYYNSNEKLAQELNTKILNGK